MPAHAFWTANAVVDPSTGTAMEYPQLKLGEDSKLWLAAASREIGRLGQGKQPDIPTGSNTMHFLDHRDLPAGWKATYLRIVAAIKMHKVETHRIRFTVGGDRIDYKGKLSTPTANLETIKIVLISIVSTLTAKMLTAGIENFYLGTPMDCYEYMRIPARHSGQHHGAVSPRPTRPPWPCPHRDSKRYVWPSTSRHLSLQPPRPALGPFPLHASQAHAGTFPSCHPSCHLLPRG
jgi:hypothetical protein